MEYRYCPLCARPLSPAVQPDGRERPACPSGHFVRYESQAAGVNAIVVRDGCVLLQRRAVRPGLGRWDLPGGYLEPMESPEAGVVRETREETGLWVAVRRLLGVKAARSVPVVILYYEAEPVGGEIRPSPESSEVRWFPAEAIPWEEMAFENARDALREWLAARKEN